MKKIVTNMWNQALIHLRNSCEKSLIAKYITLRLLFCLAKVTAALHFRFCILGCGLHLLKTNFSANELKKTRLVET